MGCLVIYQDATSRSWFPALISLLRLVLRLLWLAWLIIKYITRYGVQYQSFSLINDFDLGFCVCVFCPKMENGPVSTVWITTSNERATVFMGGGMGSSGQREAAASCRFCRYQKIFCVGALQQLLLLTVE